MGDFPYRSKTFWAGAILIVKGLIYDLYFKGDVATAVAQISLGAGLIGLRDAIKK